MAYLSADTAVVLSLTTVGLWTAAAVQDLRHREVSLFVLAVLMVIALHGRPWPWWVLATVALFWPARQRPRSLALAPIAVAVGVVTNELAPAVALAGGIVGWGLGWWGGADGIILFTLALRYGLPGLAAGVIVSGVAAVGLMMLRRQSVWRVVAAASNALALGRPPERAEDLDAEIPADTKLPAAAALGAAGLLMEVILICRMMFG